ncbi:G-type lectin S-receptor-like serine/threonine-protein kinase LECRK3 [Senna tora]|uniref:Receptor-like serine/threonine-protein kinase n=1 Tax=Senna tora TaxID=362788 RepID=A0A834WA10_9FABA|nr:G-type lectin S-receptor-like serine/threonine-protein kinase LECRK3 [Senna tora]
MAFIPSLFLLFVLLANEVTAQKNHSHIIKLGSRLSPKANSTSWFSASGLFAFGFYQQGNGFAIGIWLIGKPDNTIVWTANRDMPPLSSDSILELNKTGLLLHSENGNQELVTDFSDLAASASMLDSGNFVLYGNNSDVLWQSFDYPTDTILGNQSLFYELVSGMSKSDHSSGHFTLNMQNDGNLVAYPVNSSKWPQDAYWASETSDVNNCHVKFHLLLNKTVPLLCIKNSSNSDTVRCLNDAPSLNNKNNNSIYRAFLDSDGFFRLYAHVQDNEGKQNISELWSVPDNECSVNGFCGINSYCTFNDNQPYCNCLPGTDFIDSSKTTFGCKRNFSEAECGDGKGNAALYSMSRMENMAWGDCSYVMEEMSNEDCRASCLEDCNCGAALYDYENGECGKQGLPLRYLRRLTSKSSTLFLKVGMRSLKSWNDTTIPEPDQPPPIKTTSNKAILHIIIAILGFAFLLCSIIAISAHLLHKIKLLRYKRLLEIGDLGLNEGIITLRVFSYSELKKATNGFKEELGKGSFGAVYKGTLNKGRRLIAVKRLEKLVEEGEREFLAEMRSIGKAHHRNLVRLLGYCAEGSKRLLVYEYMSNGSLGKLIFSDTTRPDWDERRRIALDVARGILYLHEECEAPIIHCDIKPQNILMDEWCTAKISDFGLAKLLTPDQTRTFTGVRGTRGYLAPEWQKNIPISVKADVFSYGIVMLEILFCRRNLEVHVSEPEQIVLSNWVYKCFHARELNKLAPGDQVDKMLLENMIKVALWCIQDEPFLRPTMKSVVLMLEGVTDVSIPPCPSSISL